MKKQNKDMVSIEYRYTRRGHVGYVEEMRVDGVKMEVPEYLRKNPTVSYFMASDLVTGHIECKFYTKEEFDRLFHNRNAL